MSTPTANGRGGGNAPQQRELVYCHECQDEWFRDDSGLVCPTCGSDFVEIVCSPSLILLPFLYPRPITILQHFRLQ